MAVTFKTTDGTTVVDLNALATWHFAKQGLALPTNAEVIVDAYRKPGTAVS